MQERTEDCKSKNKEFAVRLVLSNMTAKYELNKDNSNHANVDDRKARILQPYTKNKSQVKNAESS